jgi:bifunctional NMN adenylyltransferase/nudix hydrolase
MEQAMSEISLLDAVGVVPARLQVPRPHPGHDHLMEYVRQRHAPNNRMIALGTKRGLPTTRNELPYKVLEYMVREQYPDFEVERILDHPISNRHWSQDLDKLLAEKHPGRRVILYGSRDSFLPQYTGVHEIHEVPSIPSLSGTQIREMIDFPTTEEGRRALIWSVRNRFSINYRTVDMAIIDSQTDNVLLIGKDEHDGLLSFPGGFNDKKGATDQEAVEWEKGEEVPGIKTGPMILLGTKPIDDPRYRGTPDGVVTTFFRTNYIEGVTKGGDDAKMAHWIHRTQLCKVLVPWHLPLAELLLDNWK